MMVDKKGQIIIVGAGACGLSAAKELAANGYGVTVLEGNDRIGGRIHTINSASFDMPIEAGAEFVHGEYPETFNILREAGIAYTTMEGRHFQIHQGKLKPMHDFIEDWDVLMDKLQEIKADIPLKDFLDNEFPGDQYTLLRTNVRRFAEGFDVADINTASTIALRDEWQQEEEKQFRIQGGYQQLIEALAASCIKNGCFINLSSIVKEIQWKQHDVLVKTADGVIYTADKIIITVPLGVLQADKTFITSIAFAPSIDTYMNAAKKIGFGSVVKIVVQFNESFWSKKEEDLGFVISNQTIPTWWTQLPNKSNTLTGWLGGPNAMALHNAEPSIVLHLALESLSNIFSVSVETLKDQLEAWNVFDWGANPFSLGAYSFASVESAAAKKILNEPIQQTIFFAGEGLYEGPHPGTVEAALVSGKNIAYQISENE